MATYRLCVIVLVILQLKNAHARTKTFCNNCCSLSCHGSKLSPRFHVINCYLEFIWLLATR